MFSIPHGRGRAAGKEKSGAGASLSPCWLVGWLVGLVVVAIRREGLRRLFDTEIMLADFPIDAGRFYH